MIQHARAIAGITTRFKTRNNQRHIKVVRARLWAGLVVVMVHVKCVPWALMCGIVLMEAAKPLARIIWPMAKLTAI